MTDRNREDLNRNQSGSSNQNQSGSPSHNQDREQRNTSSGETDRMGGQSGRDNLGVGQSDRDLTGNRNESEGAGNRSTGNIEGDENLNRR